MNRAQNMAVASEAMPVGGGFTVAFRFTGGALEADWRPNVPYGRKGRKYLRAYKLARAEFVRRVAHRTGLNILVVDL